MSKPAEGETPRTSAAWLTTEGKEPREITVAELIHVHETSCAIERELQAAEERLRTAERDGENVRAELMQYKEMWHKNLANVIQHVRDSLRVRQVIARHESYSENMPILDIYDSNGITVVIAGKDAALSRDGGEAT